MAKTPFSAKKHDINTLNSGYQYTTDDQMSIEALNNTIENSFYASNIAENVANQLSDLDPNEKIEFKGSNPNLLINGDFKIDQRGQGNYSYGYTVDRWRATNNNTTVAVNDNGITLSASSGNGYINQIIEYGFEMLKGKQVTFSISLNGNVYSATGTVPTEIPTSTRNIATINNVYNSTAVGAYAQSSGRIIVQVGVGAGNSINVNWVKLEIGSIATPFTPRPYAEELAMCQRYYWKYSRKNRGSSGTYAEMAIGFLSNNTTAMYDIHLPCEMRTVPTIRYSDLSHFVGRYDSTTYINTFTDINLWVFNHVSLILRCKFAEISKNWGLVVLRPLENSDAYLEFDAEIY